jgi:ComF family protein
VIVPVPLWPARRRERGFNQSELLARRAARACGWPVDPTALVRLRDTPPQTELPARQRWINVSEAFAVGPQVDVRGRRVLLVDDVCTTGATIEACAMPLIEAGAAGVWALVIARSVPPSSQGEGRVRAR